MVLARSFEVQAADGHPPLTLERRQLVEHRRAALRVLAGADHALALVHQQHPRGALCGLDREASVAELHDLAFR